MWVIAMYHNHNPEKGNVDCDDGLGGKCEVRDGELDGFYVDDSESAISKMLVYSSKEDAEADVEHIKKTWFSMYGEVRKLELIDEKLEYNVPEE